MNDFVYTVLVIAAWQTVVEPAKPNHGFGTKTTVSCDPNQVISIVLVSDTGFVASCGQPQICGEFMDCKGSNAVACAQLGGFMRYAEEKNKNGLFGSIRRKCCVYSKPPKEDEMHEFCETITLKHPKGKKTDIYQPAFPFTNPNPDLLVKTILKNSKGYQITACRLRCSRTTTRAPTTKKPENPRHNLIRDENFQKPEQPSKANEGHHQRHNTNQGSSGKGGSGGSCFAGDQMVITPSGNKLMTELKEGDQVLTHSLIGAPVFQRVEWFIHRDKQQMAEFLTLRTDNGMSLKLTKKHLLPLIPCNMEPGEVQAKYLNQYFKKAEEATVGSCVLVHDENRPIQHIVEIQESQEQGIYSPITSHGSIVVNNIYSSCYSVTNDQIDNIAANSAVKVFLELYRRISSFTNGAHRDTIDLPVIVKLLINVAKIV